MFAADNFVCIEFGKLCILGVSVAEIFDCRYHIECFHFNSMKENMKILVSRTMHRIGKYFPL